jgi:hypothetical protein
VIRYKVFKIAWNNKVTSPVQPFVCHLLRLYHGWYNPTSPFQPIFPATYRFAHANSPPPYGCHQQAIQNGLCGESESYRVRLHTSTFVKMKSRAFATLFKGGKASKNYLTAFSVILPIDFAIPRALSAFRFSLVSDAISTM